MVNEFQSNIDDAHQTANEIYSDNFDTYFSNVRELGDRMRSAIQPITDQELEDVLTVLPLNLFSAAEAVNRLKLDMEIIKLESKKRKVEIQKNLPEKSKISKSDLLASELADAEITLAIYSSVISRAESEMSYCKELIMGCKKIWDGRRAAEKSNPVGELNIDTLPEYQKDVYIK